MEELKMAMNKAAAAAADAHVLHTHRPITSD